MGCPDAVIPLIVDKARPFVEADRLSQSDTGHHIGQWLHCLGKSENPRGARDAPQVPYPETHHNRNRGDIT